MTAPKSAPKTPKPTTPESAPAKRVYQKSVQVDFGKLSIGNETEPISTRSGVAASYEPPAALVTALNTSWETRRVLSERKVDGKTVVTYIGAGKGLTVSTPEEAVTVERALRKCAKHMGLGIAVELLDTSDGKIRVRFAAKSPRNYPKNPNRSK